ncbi:type II secretion system F family protein [Phytomonospora sp. NPDC050363]|uniref:type II secretion system F family protein n=1 Tax=Phytomonospora sp. NPDC050363 TaxID=3155642 RepID=UPI0033D5F3E1
MKPVERLRGLRTRSAPTSARERLRTRAARPALAVLIVIAAVVVLGPLAGLVTGCAAAFAVDRALRTREPRAVLRARAIAADELPFALDLLAACLTAGSPTVTAIRTVASASAPPLAERLHAVAAALDHDRDPEEAWRPLADLPGGERLIAAAVRSSGSGAALAAGLRRLAEESREAAAHAGEAAAERAGVLVVMPVGLCFLPAFVLMGLVPVIVAVLGDVMPTNQ